ncbi:LEAF RUST 10 DISEASE-RESISTANCE LOCUS RECEPTOR-LIKE PROTEIN KINASE-like 1.2 [Cryptomeria japonica]|uniref:LEAF RUST 10 DISEASE-RESISTANCE LOCUS RECEPTOR-LIKE PROTEIN KINASE-like 1.2 n=1 Tax=Cryptomeria japonica TaxID=3369 RepID=UPI0027D9FE7C|nr:LEAF RUST 10 DISEASE-RESISTANCE LOCUS RECEPTOR-LIKE PROTEIN KINASE-like 1.2 [Cryptomeria japonica]
MPMAPILALFTSIQSPVHHSVSRLNLLYTFIAYTLLIPCSLCADLSYTNCESNQTCGGIKIPYPFGLRESGCGLPDLQVDCEDKGHLVIKIGNQRYTILNFFPDNQTSTITEDTSFQNCSFSYNLNEDAIQDGGLFDQIQRHNISLQVLVCDLQCVALLPGLEVPGCSFKWVTVEEASTHWNIAEEQDQKCKSCVSSGGLCGFNISDLNQFLCFCEDAPHQTTCSSVIAGNAVKKKNSKKSNLGLIIGGVSGGLALLLIGGGFLICRNPKQRRRNLSPSPTLITKEVEYSASRDIEAGVQQKIGNLTIFSYEILKYATNNFSGDKILGDGGFGSVYLGKLPDGRAVAVKRMYQDNYRRHDQFINEVQILSSLQHPNLVGLYGCTSPEGKDLLLVYEYVKNGTVADHLHGEKRGKGLNWEIRLKISVGTAHALAFLHKQTPPVLHRDVKTTNILVDEYFKAKVADFGLSRFMPLNVTHVSTAPQGTPGYLDPEYYECFQLTEKSDVYSFGVVLVELISSKLAVDINRTRKEISLANMALTKITEGALQELVDSNLGFDFDNEVRSSITAVAELAFRCLQASKDDRPDMKEVVAQLDQIDQNWVHVKNPDSHTSFGSDGGKKVLSGMGPPSPTSVQDKWPSTKTTPNNSA